MDTAMKIQQVELFQIKWPLLAPFETSFGVSHHKEAILAKVTASSGVSGWGEYAADGPGYSYETLETGWHIARDYLIPMLFKAPVDKPTDLPERFKWVRGHNFAKSFLEGALWDIAAQQAGLSLRDFIGKVTGYTDLKDRLAVGVSIGIQPSTEALVERILGFRADGYHRIKIKIKPGRDLQDARAARAAIPGVPLMVDANSAYTLQDVDMLKQMDELDLLMIEQPLAYDDIYEHHKLQRQLKTRICLDESIHTPNDARFAIELGACKIINIKQGRVGGLTNAIAVHDIAMAAGVPVWKGGMLETGIGRALNVALAALPNFSLPSDLSASNRYYKEDLIEPGFALDKDNMLPVPTGPGLGVTLATDRLARATVRSQTFKAD
jgi:o-succinylbenzoate synthase